MNIKIKNMLLALLAVPVLALGFSVGVAPSAFAVTTTPTCTGDAAKDGLGGAAQCAKSADQPADLFGTGGIFETISNVLLFIIGAVSVIMLILGGIRYTISQGDSTAVTAAKNTILYAIIGLVVAILAYAAVHFVIGSFVTTP